MIVAIGALVLIAIIVFVGMLIFEIGSDIHGREHL